MSPTGAASPTGPVSTTDTTVLTDPTDPTGPVGTVGPASVAWLVRAAAAVARHPRLWPVAARQAGALVAPGWWRRPPFLPLPPAGYLRFRSQTAYGGDGDRLPAPEDLVTWLRWCRAVRLWRP